MDLEELMKKMLGEHYKDNLTEDDLEKFFKDKILGTGEYENKGKADAEKKRLEKQIADLNSKLSGKMSDEEKRVADEQAREEELEELKKQLAESKALNSRTKALSGLTEAKTKAGIKDKDKDFEELVSSISFEDSEKASKIGSYISTLVKNAYEAGQANGTKNQLGIMGSFKAGSDEGEKEKGALGKELAETVKASQKVEKDFFERK